MLFQDVGFKIGPQQSLFTLSTRDLSSRTYLPVSFDFGNNHCRFTAELAGNTHRVDQSFGEGTRSKALFLLTAGAGIFPNL